MLFVEVCGGGNTRISEFRVLRERDLRHSFVDSLQEFIVHLFKGVTQRRSQPQPRQQELDLRHWWSS